MNNPTTPTDGSTQAVLEHLDPATLVIDTNVRSLPHVGIQRTPRPGP